jgi:hypothetical protein
MERKRVNKQGKPNETKRRTGFRSGKSNNRNIELLRQYMQEEENHRKNTAK